jgi:type II secretion system protein N
MSEAAAGRAHWRRGATTAAAVAYLVAATVLLSVWRMPLQELLEAGAQRLRAATGHSVHLGPARLGWSGRLGIEGVHAELSSGARKVPVVLESVEVTPAWLRTLLGRPAARLDASAYGGEVSVSVQASDLGLTRARSVSIRLEGVDIAGIEALAVWLGGQSQGICSARVELEMKGPQPEDWKGSCLLSADGLHLTGVGLGGLTLERLPLGSVQIELELLEDGASVQIRRCETRSPELEVSCSGSIELARDVQQSQAQIFIQARLMGQLEMSLGELAGVRGYVPDERGWLRVSVSGPPGALRVAPAR